MGKKNIKRHISPGAAAAVFVVLLAAAIMIMGEETQAATEPAIQTTSKGISYDESGNRIYMVGDTISVGATGAYSDVLYVYWSTSGSCIQISSATQAAQGTATTAGTFLAVKEGTGAAKYAITTYFTWPYYWAQTDNGEVKVRVVDYIDNISFSSTSVSLTTGDTKEMAVETDDDYYSITMSEMQDGFYTYTSSDSSVASVSSTGTVTAKKAGTATITCTTTNGLTATCTVTVKALSVTKITLNKSSVTLKIGKTQKLSYTLSPTDAETTVTWSSSNKKVATVSSSGKIMAKKAGTATITAKTANGKTATCKVTVKKNPTSIKLNKSKLTLLIGKSKTLKATISPSSAVSDVTWKSSKSSVATVDANGKITAKKAGTTTITATSYNGLTAKCKVTVKKVDATKIKLSKSKLTLNKGKSTSLTYTLTPSNATSTVKWTSSNKSVATVSSSGKITAKKAGTTTITAKTSSGEKATCKVTVKVPITSVKLNKTSTTIDVGTTTTLTATISPSGTTSSKTLTWSSSDTSVATVNSKGKVTAKGGGTATITVKTSNGKKATCKVTVKVPITGVSLNKTSATINAGSTTTLTATITPGNTTSSKTLAWTSSNTSVAAVNSSGKVTANSPGTATITVKTSNGKEAACVVTVKAPITKVTLNQSSVTLDPGDTTTLSATISPTNTTDSTTLTWSSSDSSVATVSSSGVVTAVAHGSATITVKTSNGKTAACNVSVTQPITGVSLNYTSITVDPGDTFTLTASVEPSDTTEDTTITWTCSPSTVATVDSSGTVTTLRDGFANVYATTSNGLKAKCSVTVNEVEAASIAFDAESYEIEYGDPQTLTLTMTPANATSDVTWSSSDSSIAYVDDDGKVTVRKAGTVTITAETDNGLSASCEVTALRHISQIYLKDESNNIADSVTVCENLTYTLTAHIAPNQDTVSDDITLTWTTSDSSVVTVDTSESEYRNSTATNTNYTVTTAVLVPQSQGTATVTATTSNGLSASMEVTVRAPAAVTLSFEESSIELDPSSYSYTKTYYSDWLECYYTPEDADDTLTWTSSDTSVVRVYDNNDEDEHEGYETADLSVQGAGTAVITVTSRYGDASASITVTVDEYDD